LNTYIQYELKKSIIWSPFVFLNYASKNTQVGDAFRTATGIEPNVNSINKTAAQNEQILRYIINNNYQLFSNAIPNNSCVSTQPYVMFNTNEVFLPNQAYANLYRANKDTMVSNAFETLPLIFTRSESLLTVLADIEEQHNIDVFKKVFDPHEPIEKEEKNIIIFVSIGIVVFILIISIIIGVVISNSNSKKKNIPPPKRMLRR